MRDFATPPAHIIMIDVRDLPPPEPLERILKAINLLSPHDELLVTHHREPLLLYEQLDIRGYDHQTRSVAPDQWEIRIRRSENLSAAP